MKDMFYNSGFNSKYDGRCGSCPFWIANYSEDICHCTETDQDVKSYVLNGHINKGCPFIQND